MSMTAGDLVARIREIGGSDDLEVKADGCCGQCYVVVDGAELEGEGDKAFVRLVTS